MLVLLFVYLHLISAELIVNPLGPTVSQEYTNCLKGLISNNFVKPGLVFVPRTTKPSFSVSKIREDVLKLLHHKLKFTVQTSKPIVEKEIECDDTRVCDEVLSVDRDFFAVIPLANYYIIIVSGFTDFKDIVNKLVTLRTWNPRAFFIVLCLRLKNLHEIPQKHYPERMLTYLFKRNALSAVVIVPNHRNYRDCFIYGWKPFDPPTYCGYHNETAYGRVRIQNICSQGVLENKKKLFENIIPQDLTGCYLDVIALKRQPFISDDEDDPNLEKKLIEELAGIFKLETKYELVNEFRGEKDDEEWSGALRHIVSGKGDVLFGGVFPDYDVHEDFDSSIPYLTDFYTWVVPRAYKSPPWVSLIIIFQEWVWYSAAVVFVLCVFTWKILAVLSNESQYHKSFDHCFLNTWYITLGFSAYVRPVRESLRIFFVFFNIYCILFLTAYQTKLIDVLTNPSFEKQMKTMKELIESDLKFGGTEEIHDLFYNSTDYFDALIGEKWIDVNDIEGAMIDVVVHRNFSLLCSNLELMYMASVMPELSDAFGKPTYYQFEDKVFTIPLELVTQFGFPLIERFSRVLSALTQMGVVEEILNTYSEDMLRARANILREVDKGKSSENPLSLLHLEGGFLALAVGYISGTIVLILEIFCNTQYVRNKSVSFMNYLKRLKAKYKMKTKMYLNKKLKIDLANKNI